MFKELYNYWFGLSVSIYLADRMTGLTGYKIWQNYRSRKKIYRRKGIRVNSPVPGEGIKATRRPLPNRPGSAGTLIWLKDKLLVRKSNIMVYPLLKKRSQGCEWELVLARGSCWKPTVYLHDNPGFISKEQSDIVCQTDQQAARLIVKQFGSRFKRLIWRFKMLNKSIPKWLGQQIKEFVL